MIQIFPWVSITPKTTPTLFKVHVKHLKLIFKGYYPGKVSQLIHESRVNATP